MLYKYAYGQGSLDKYVDFTLSTKYIHGNESTETCRFREYRAPFSGEYTIVYYEILAARLLFFTIFEVRSSIYYNILFSKWR